MTNKIFHMILKRCKSGRGVCAVRTRSLHCSVRGDATSSLLTRSLFTASLFLLIGSHVARAEDYSGIYFLPNKNPNQYDADTPITNYYLCPTQDYLYFVANNNYQKTPNNGMPFMTTYQCLNDADYDSGKAIWQVIKHNEQDFYYIKHVKDGKYLTTNLSLSSGGGNRLRVHLETMDTPSDLALFKITLTANGYYQIEPKGNSGFKLNPTSGNTPSLQGTATAIVEGAKSDGPTDPDNSKVKIPINGTIGLWNNTTNNDRWDLLAAVPQYALDGNTVSLSFYGLDTGDSKVATIYYTTDGETIPTATDQYKYTAPFNLSQPTTIKVIAVTTDGQTEVCTYFIDAVKTPTITVSEAQRVVLETATEDATIYYTTDGSIPTTSSTLYTEPISAYISGKTIKTIAVKKNMLNSEIATLDLPTFTCATPVIYRISTSTFGIRCTYPTEGYTIYYTINGTTPSESSTPYPGSPITFDHGITVKAIVMADGYNNSAVTTKEFALEMAELSGSGTEASPYLIANDDEMETFFEMVNAEMTTGIHFELKGDVSYSQETPSAAFEGVFDGGMHTINGLKNPLFETVKNAVVKNVMFKNVNINSGMNVGAICGEASGYSRIYNCGILPSNNKFENEISSLTGSNYVGGLVGWLKDDSRVINCFSFASIKGGKDVAGIVGHNNVASNTKVSDGKYTNLKTAVVNCMFYGDITGGTNVYPVYGGAKMLNKGNNSINNYDFYRAEASLSPTDYNCSWPALEENLTRFEYYRSLLNANRELCGWWVKSDVAPSILTTAEVQAIEKDASLIKKWVLDPSIAPYPILKPFGKYSSVINPDPNKRIDPKTKVWVSRSASVNTIKTNAEPDTQGEKLGSITVNINAGSHHSGTDSRDITITAMDIDNNDFCYGKIQLPYYNEVFGNPNASDWGEKYGDNYGEYVVTGWMITEVTNGELGSFSTDTITGFNFADRNTYAKDLYANSKRVFAQGGFYNVPYGVTAISIKAYWGKAYYMGNGSTLDYDKPGSGDISFAPAGTRAITFGGQAVHNMPIHELIANATVTKGATVYDCALVLTGNYQHKNSSNNIGEKDGKPFTLMSVDLDFDNEPDYCLEWQLGQNTTRAMISPVRFDFLPIVPLGYAMKEDGSKNLYTIGKMTPYNHFEVTETAFLNMGQFDYENKGRGEGPIILNNGKFIQVYRGTDGSDDQHVTYWLLGGHVQMPCFSPGAHPNAGQKWKSRHCAVSVLGGEFEKFFLTGNYNSNVTPNVDDPHCYISGGKMDMVAAAAKEGINGSVYWKIDHAYIGEFYGGGITADKVVTGKINITIDRSRVRKFCGGPMFGDMATNMGVTTQATGTTFGVFYGAGNGGTNYMQYASTDATINVDEENGTDYNTYDWEENGNLKSYTPLTYRNKATGYHAKYELEMINSSAGTQDNAVNRTYLYAAQFATTNTGAVSSTLTDCTVTDNFYGAGNLGGVNGDVTSLLQGTTKVLGNVFGAGFSAQIPTVDIYSKEYTKPQRDVNTTVITPPVYPTPTTYTWTNETTIGETTLSKSSPDYTGPKGNYLFTEVPLNNLGTVSGDVNLSIEGTCEIGGDVYGGGDESNVTGSTTINLKGGTINGSVYGGARGNETTAPTVGNTNVNLNPTATINADGSVFYPDKCIVKGSIFGCNNLNGTPKGNATVNIWKTWGNSRTASENLDNIDDTKHSYHLKAVYGGGDLAAYKPTDLANGSTHVNIYGCDLTSIRQVYGGGNAASTPATQVDINGTYEIEEVFGGGNGKDSIKVNGVLQANPGANVGFYAYTDSIVGETDTPENRAQNYGYGSGQARVNIHGGKIHRVYGGSNTKGNVRIVAVTMLEDESGCPFDVDEAYGGGKSAPMDGASRLEMACIPGLKAAYGGAEAANVQGNVNLTITNGNFDRVFGGNNVSGTISGTITVNIEETGCHPIIIGQLYGGGNQAPYTAPMDTVKKVRMHGPTLNVRSFSSIGEVYGGGYGATAVVTGDTYVNVNACEGKVLTDAEQHSVDSLTGNRKIEFYEYRRTANGEFEMAADGTRVVDTVRVELYLPPRTMGRVGAINNVYGGGNAAKVDGNTNVRIGTTTKEVFESPLNDTESDHTHIVKGADIWGNVYGGGNAAEVTGNTYVVVGKAPE